MTVILFTFVWSSTISNREYKRSKLDKYFLDLQKIAYILVLKQIIKDSRSGPATAAGDQMAFQETGLSPRRPQRVQRHYLRVCTSPDTSLHRHEFRISDLGARTHCCRTRQYLVQSSRQRRNHALAHANILA